MFFQSYRNISSVTGVIFTGRKRTGDVNKGHKRKGQRFATLFAPPAGLSLNQLIIDLQAFADLAG